MKLSFAPTVVTNRLLGVGWGTVIALLLVLAIDSFIAKPGGDSLIFMYVAQGILEGEVPYLDRWDNKGPLLYLINAVGLLIDEVWGIWIVQALFLLGASTFAFLALRKPFGTLPALFALALFLAFFARFVQSGNFTEQYGLLFQFLTLYLFLRSHELPNPAPSQARFAFLHFSIGALGAASFLLRPNLVALWIPIGLYWLFLRGSSLRKLAWAVIGGAAILLAVAALFAAVGALGALWEAVFEFSFAQSTASLEDRLGVVRRLFEQSFPISLLVIAAWCISGLILIQRRAQDGHFRSTLVLTLILLPLEVVSFSLSGFSYLHYYLAALPVIALLLALLAWTALEYLPIARALTATLILFSAAYFPLHASDFAQIAGKYTRGNLFAEDGEARLARRIGGLTRPEDRILVWGKGARIHLLSERDAPSRFFYHHPLVKPNFTDQTIREEFFSAVKQEMPVLIVDSHFSWFAPLDSEERAGWKPHDRYMHDLDDFKPFFEFVEANYVDLGEFASYVVYGLRSEDSAESLTAQGELIVRSTYDVYLDGRTLTYVKTPCTQDDAAKRFILHVIPFDKSVIGGNEHANLDFNSVEGMNWKVGEGCIVSQVLPEYPIAYIRTGQYNESGTAHDWLSEHYFSEPK